MCCTLRPATLASTILYASEVQHEGRKVHVTGYQNKAESPEPNAMILPIPARSKLGPDNMLDMREAKHVLTDYHLTCRPVLLGSSVVYGSRSLTKSAPIVFDKGSYTVVLAERATDIPSVLDQVPASKRIQNPNPEIWEAYDQLYPGWPVAVCCWAGQVEAEPLFWWYDPMYEKHLFMPALDAHDGEPPQLDTEVAVDHFLITGHDRGGYEVRFRAKPPDTIRPFLAPRVDTITFDDYMPNGDFWVRPGSLPERLSPRDISAKIPLG